jgi:RNA polymerase sigma factor (TIGR02999 family)
MSSEPRTVTQLLLAWREGDRSALDRLMPLVYEELRRLAAHYMRGERTGHTLQTTALVNEAYLRLVDHKNIQWQNRTHFFAVASQAMRRVLVDHARSRGYAKRGGGSHRVTFDEGALISHEQDPDLLALDEALSRLSAIDPRKAQIVELRYFGGLSVEETAEVLKVSAVTVMREWSKAKAWLFRELNPETSDDA